MLYKSAINWLGDSAIKHFILSVDCATKEINTEKNNNT
jgi:hypothetical protein